MTRAERLKLLRKLARLLQPLRESTEEAERSAWYKAHGSIIAHKLDAKTGITNSYCVADTEVGHDKWTPPDFTKSSANCRHIRNSSPRTVAEIIATIDKLIPDVKKVRARP